MYFRVINTFMFIMHEFTGLFIENAFVSIFINLFVSPRTYFNGFTLATALSTWVQLGAGILVFTITLIKVWTFFFNLLCLNVSDFFCLSIQQTKIKALLYKSFYFCLFDWKTNKSETWNAGCSVFKLWRCVKMCWLLAHSHLHPYLLLVAGKIPPNLSLL